MKTEVRNLLRLVRRELKEFAPNGASVGLSRVESMLLDDEPAPAVAPKSAKSTPFRVGDAYLIRTVTNYWTGRVASVVGDFLVLSDAAWIADTGRYSEATDEAHLKEVEPCAEPVFVGVGSIIDARAWTAALPRKVK